METFVDTVLMEFDAEWALEIKQYENYPKALAIIEDHTSALTYLAYISLMVEAVPPNFYSYYGGKAGAFLFLEVILTLVLGLLTMGTGVAARMTVITAKLAVGTKRIHGLAHAAKALDSFTKTLEGLVDVLSDYDRLAEKLSKRPLGQYQHSPAQTLTVRKASIQRTGECRRCGSEDHKTPRSQRGEIEYI
ncbi:hypothetical protein [Photobacterium nomapromontoriensis]|uniref:hypothetical protein n=1 Tax=Photobacterium nomapromontoriensis TaxID=2910237 RepID=UPI003D0FF85D